ncbi:MAG TPA: hypothetical protein VGN46_13600 [Luteibacter sp.]|jgi:hypothetical protein|uniref:hypothetical protein n=1 Tax=Luteibacter sp. TaxID=1886636 RepID=UPI002F41A460
MSNRTQENRAIKLNPPSIHDAVDGGLGYDDIARNPGRIVVVSTGPWGDIQPGDVIEVLWGRNLEVIATHHYEQGENLTPQIRVEASTLSRFGEGFIPLAAKIHLFDSDLEYQTPSVDVLVKLSVPGGLDPNPETTSRNESLAMPLVDPKTLPDDLTGIVVEVPPYRNMAVGDRVTLQWHTQPLRYGPLTSSEIGKPVRFAIDKTTAGVGAGGDIEVRYQIHDLVANWSLWSPSTTVTVPPGEDAPIAPWVLGTVRDEGKAIDLKSLGINPLTVRVEGHAGALDDEIFVTWEGVTEAGKAIVYACPSVRIQRPGQTVDVLVPNDLVVPLAGGHASAGYSIVSNGVPGPRSRRRQLSIVGSPRGLVTPSITEAADGTMDPRATKAGAHVVVAAWDGIDRDDRCYLEWTGKQSDGQTTYYRAALNGADMIPDRTLVFVVPPHEVSRLAGGSLRVRYAVSVQATLRYADGTRVEPLVHLESPWLELEIIESAAPLSIDSTPAILAGPIVRLEKRVTIPPAGSFIARVATGGVPPYRYSASSGAVEVDEATGRVVSLRDGEATVTVTDAKGASASYLVTVSNVLHLVDLEKELLWHAAATESGKLGGRLPHVEEWDALRAAYGGNPEVRESAAWTDTPASSVARFAVFPNTGAREARRSAWGPGRSDPDERWIPIGPKLAAASVWIVTTGE